MADHWIQGAIKRPGAFTAKAKAAGKGVQEYAQEKAHAPGLLGEEARLARTLKTLHEASGGLIRGVGAATKGTRGSHFD